MRVRQRLILLVLMIATATVTRPAGAQCIESPAARDALRETLLRPAHANTLRVYGLTIAVRDSLVLVTDSATCGKAAAAIARDVGVPVGDFALVLVRAGNKYVADSDRGLRGFETLFVLDSSMTPLWPVDILPAISNVPRPATETICFASDDDFSEFVAGKIRVVLTSPRQKWYRERLGLEGIPADSVHHVADDAMCARAIAAVRSHLTKPVDHVQLTLFRLGRFHWAETRWPSAGEWSLVFILDSTATRVVGQY